jgi:hypothetical protein
MATAAAATMQWPTQWTREDVKIFKIALVMVPEDLPNRWEKIAEQVHDKSAAEVRDLYEVEVPNYILMTWL